MAALNQHNSFIEDVFEGVHNFSTDQLMVALCAAANAPTAEDSLLEDLTEIDYTNLSSRAVTTISSSQTDGVYKLILEDLVLTATGGPVGPFRYIDLYNDTPAGKPLIGWADYGSDLTLQNGEVLTLDFDGTSGAISATVTG